MLVGPFETGGCPVALDALHAMDAVEKRLDVAASSWVLVDRRSALATSSIAYDNSWFPQTGGPSNLSSSEVDACLIRGAGAPPFGIALS